MKNLSAGVVALVVLVIALVLGLVALPFMKKQLDKKAADKAKVKTEEAKADVDRSNVNSASSGREGTMQKLRRVG